MSSSSSSSLRLLGEAAASIHDEEETCIDAAKMLLEDELRTYRSHVEVAKRTIILMNKAIQVDEQIMAEYNLKLGRLTTDADRVEQARYITNCFPEIQSRYLKKRMDAGSDATRKSMLKKIEEVLRMRKPNADEEWTRKLPAFARKLEAELYEHANTLAEYMDDSTLVERLKVAATGICKRTPAPAAAAGKKTVTVQEVMNNVYIQDRVQIDDMRKYHGGGYSLEYSGYVDLIYNAKDEILKDDAMFKHLDAISPDEMKNYYLFRYRNWKTDVANKKRQGVLVYLHPDGNRPVLTSMKDIRRWIKNGHELPSVKKIKLDIKNE